MGPAASSLWSPPPSNSGPDLPAAGHGLGAPWRRGSGQDGNVGTWRDPSSQRPGTGREGWETGHGDRTETLAWVPLREGTMAPTVPWREEWTTQPHGGTECSCLRKLGWAAPWQHPGFLYTLPWLPHPPGTLGFPRTPKFAKEGVEFPWARFLPPSKHDSVGLKTQERQVQAPPPQSPPLRPWPRPLSSGPSTGAGRGLSGPAAACALCPPEGAGAVPRVGKWTMV